MELRPFRALRGQPRFKERRPGLWIDRQVLQRDGQTLVLPLLIGLVRLAENPSMDLSAEPPSKDAVAKRVGALVSAKADEEPCLLVTRAPLAAALSTTRRPDMIVLGESGARHDLIRINDFAQHVELQGLVKNAEARLLAGGDLWEAAQQFSSSSPAAKLPGAKYKLCAILDERLLVEPNVGFEAPKGVLGFSLEDPVY